MCEISYTFCQVVFEIILIISELKMCVEYHRHSDIKHIFSFRA